jgi:hypothetical protein
MTSDFEIIRLAASLIRDHGDQASLEATQKANAMFEKGDLQAQSDLTRVVETVEGIPRLPVLDRLLGYDPVMLPTIGAIRQVLLELEHVLESMEAPKSHFRINGNQICEVINWLDRIGERLKSEIWVEQEGLTGWQAMIDGIYLLHEDLAQHLPHSD